MSECFNRYEYDLLELCGRIHGDFTGTGDGIPNDEAVRYREWLSWRLEGGWEPTPTFGNDVYDGCVRALCDAALWELSQLLRTP